MLLRLFNQQNLPIFFETGNKNRQKNLPVTQTAIVPMPYFFWTLREAQKTLGKKIIANPGRRGLRVKNFGLVPPRRSGGGG